MAVKCRVNQRTDVTLCKRRLEMKKTRSERSAHEGIVKNKKREVLFWNKQWRCVNGVNGMECRQDGDGDGETPTDPVSYFC